MKDFRFRTQKALLATLGLALILSLSVDAQSRRQNKDNKDKKDDGIPISILDSSQAQWGLRSVNDSVYQGYTVNGVYLERGRQKLPDNFPRYQPRTIDSDIVVKSKATGQATPKNESRAPSTIRINGKDQPLNEGD